MLDRNVIYKRLVLCLLLSVFLHGAVVYFGWLKPPAHLAVSAPVEVSFLPVVDVAQPVAEKIVEKKPEPKKKEISRPLKKFVPQPQPKPKVVKEEKKVVAEPLIAEPDLVEHADEDVVKENSLSETQDVDAVADVGLNAPEIKTSEQASPEMAAGPVIVDAVPRYISNPRPEYPYLARQRLWEGVVWLLVDVSADGFVDDLVIEESSGYKILDRAATRAVSRWRFEPATRAGIPVSSRARIPVRFRLEGR